MNDLSDDARALLRAGQTALAPSAGELDATRAALRAKLSAVPDLAPGERCAADGASGIAQSRVWGARLHSNLIKLVLSGIAAGVAVVYIALRAQPITPASPPTAADSPAPKSVAGAQQHHEQLSAMPESTADSEPRASESKRSTPSSGTGRSRSASRPATRGMPEQRRVSRSARRTATPPLAAAARESDALPTALSAGTVRPAPRLQASAQEVAPSGAASTTGPTTAPALVEPTAQRVPVNTDTLAQEIALIRGARALLQQGHSEAALHELDSYVARFPHGRLREEQLALRALALCGLGRVQAAQRIVEHIQNVAPDSPHLSRIERACRPPR